MNSQSDESEQGEIYKCSINRNKYCYEFKIQEPHIYSSTIKEKQFLGYSMASNDKFVVSLLTRQHVLRTFNVHIMIYFLGLCTQSQN